MACRWPHTPLTRQHSPAPPPSPFQSKLEKKKLVQSQRGTCLTELSILVPAQPGARPGHGLRALTDALQLLEKCEMSTLTLWDSSATSSPGWWPPAAPFWVVGQGTEGWAGRSSPLGDGNQHFCQQGCAETKNLRLAPRSRALDDSLPPPGARHRPRAQLLVPFGTFSLTGTELGEGRASPVWDVAASSPSLLPHPAPASLAVQAGTMRVVPENWKHKKMPT